MKLTRPLLIATLMTATFAACGSSTTTSGDTSPAASAAASPSAAAAAVINSAPVTVAGASVIVLTDGRGYTLYYRTNDTSAVAGCTGACAAVWPPILQATGNPTAGTGVTGTLTVVESGNGRQVEYNGHPLYLYARDTGPSQTTGEGVGGVWHVATTTIPAAM
ncbi:MAG: hypothetical protein QOE92_688 [Chloroflexota bacterium]|nr:hypothetical protein [Chloroflexota bacterium]